MARWTETWLSGLGGVPRGEGDHPGAGLGLPEDGPGSVASVGGRLGAFLVDVIGSGFIAQLLAPGDAMDPSPADGLTPVLVFLFVLVFSVTFLGRTPGMALLGMRVASTSPGRVDPVRSTVRAVLVSLVLPVVITDKDGRGLHDRAAGTVVVRT